jgi:hypothetical protein
LEENQPDDETLNNGDRKDDRPEIHQLAVSQNV